MRSKEDVKMGIDKYVVWTARFREPSVKKAISYYDKIARILEKKKEVR